MKQIAAAALLFVVALPLSAEETDDGLSLMERGAQMFMEGILKEVEPALDGLGELGPTIRGFVEEMGPALGDVLEQVEDWSAYHPPEILPNGDIILRRKAPKVVDPLAQDDGQIDL